MGLLVAIVSLGLVCLVLEVLQLRKVFVPLTVAALLLLFGVTSYELYTGNTIIHISDLPEMLIFNQYAKGFSALFILLTALILSMVPFCTRERPTQRADYSSIFLFLLSGVVAMVSFSNLSMFFIGLEVLSISLYLLSASNVKNRQSNEAGMKYFLMGSFASSIILFGIALVYGATGSFDMGNIAAIVKSGDAPQWYGIGVSMILIGMMFKVAAVPFHFWAPDVYQGAPTVVTTLMSTLVKVAAMATLYKLMTTMIPYELGQSQRIIILVISILTMTIGNLSAMKQINMKRLLAFSGISHAGFMLMSLLYLHKDAQILLYYAAAYALAGVAAFAVIIAVCHAKGTQDIGMFSGLGRKKPLLAVILTFAMLSMAGIPIFSGFWAKLFLFGQMLSIGEYLLVIVGVINSVISVFFYFRVINVMFIQPSDDSPVEYPAVIGYVATIAIALNILLGIFPSVITGLTL